MRSLDKAVEEQTTLSQLELLVLRPTVYEHSSITLGDLMDLPLDMVMKVNEYLDILDAYKEVSLKEKENKGM